MQSNRFVLRRPPEKTTYPLVQLLVCVTGKFVSVQVLMPAHSSQFTFQLLLREIQLCLRYETHINKCLRLRIPCRHNDPHVLSMLCCDEKRKIAFVNVASSSTEATISSTSLFFIERVSLQHLLRLVENDLLKGCLHPEQVKPKSADITIGLPSLRFRLPLERTGIERKAKLRFRRGFPSLLPSPQRRMELTWY